MNSFFRTLFGTQNASGNRAVVGQQEGVQQQELPYFENSARRLDALQDLYQRYKGTAHTQKLLTVYDKTRRIHVYLSGRGRLHELELFHLQHTDHFLSTFTAIIDTKRPRTAVKEMQMPATEQATARPEVIGRTFVLGPFRRETKEVMAVKKQNQRAPVVTAQAQTEVPQLAIPHISIDTYSKIVYLREDANEGLSTHEIGYSSTPEEKADFIAFVSSRLGISGISYAGNTMLYLPADTSAKQPADMVPVIHWNGAPYALSLEEERLFPVSSYRKGR
ncbi:hypothetical protein [Pontibacter oryzae]|uniref:Uncharacterized protein n=1 Tax=Pontibacter oryzae TaxID=2304593 RepID=A0A399SF66_9BACT|nr:hypothetical protein [Pontibacter oryzae]RIJ41838.1 hypothetical protein D1627_07435 [Pontibacter oryzae]